MFKRRSPAVGGGRKKARAAWPPGDWSRPKSLATIGAPSGRRCNGYILPFHVVRLGGQGSCSTAQLLRSCLCLGSSWSGMQPVAESPSSVMPCGMRVRFGGSAPGLIEPRFLGRKGGCIKTAFSRMPADAKTPSIGEFAQKRGWGIGPGAVENAGARKADVGGRGCRRQVGGCRERQW